MSETSQGCCGPSRPLNSDAVADSIVAQTITASQPRQDLEVKMIELAGGSFLMGDDSEESWQEDGEGPVHEVMLCPFLMDATTVTNADFSKFIEDTGYQTDAEKFGWSYVFHLFVPKSIKKRGRCKPLAGLEWWLGVEGTTWRKPEGPGSNIKKRMDHPVVHVSWNDAAAFAQWAGKRLPTEAEWEFAARAGSVRTHFPWGNDLVPNGKYMANTWQGTFPHKNTAEDGWVATAPAKSFRANAWGFYNFCGNVWEWVNDYFSPDAHKLSVSKNPKGPEAGDMRVNKGGSYLCHVSYCNRYRIAARHGNTPDSSLGHTGFRCAADLPQRREAST